MGRSECKVHSIILHASLENAYPYTIGDDIQRVLLIGRRIAQDRIISVEDDVSPKSNSTTLQVGKKNLIVVKWQH